MSELYLHSLVRPHGIVHSAGRNRPFIGPIYGAEEESEHRLYATDLTEKLIR
jgi:hypothetical protein